MKTKIFSLILTLAGTIGFTSCSDWFDVDPKTDIKADKFFNTENGYNSALQGIYTTMAMSPTYGGNLSFGMLDQLALMYDFVPTGTSDKEEIYIYDQETPNGYNTKTKFAESWISAYNLIANGNNLMKWLDSKGVNVLDSLTRSTFKGEIYGLRAYIHFDLLRLWGPMGYDEADSTKYIPYRKIADNTKQPRLTPKALIGNILADLELAEQHLQADKGVTLAENDRRFRMNYYAVKALQARVYNHCGMKQEAYNAAKEVIDNCGLQLQSENSEDPVMFAETVFGIYLYKMSDGLPQHFSEGPDFTTQYMTRVETLSKYFENFTGTSSDVDIRMKSSAVLGYNSEKYISRKYIKNDYEVVPLIRLPELYYIMCESAELSEAPEYVNAVKGKRGYTKSSLSQNFQSEEERFKTLDSEYRMEFYAEGQYFHFLKRNKVSTLSYAPDVTLDKEKYIFPLPDNEIQYGWSPDTEEQ